MDFLGNFFFFYFASSSQTTLMSPVFKAFFPLRPQKNFNEQLKASDKLHTSAQILPPGISVEGKKTVSTCTRSNAE